MLRLLAHLFSNLALASVLAMAGVLAMLRGYAHDLPSEEKLRDYRPKMLSRVYSGEGNVLAEFAKERRVFIPIDEVPDIVKYAFVSAEDKNFYSHPGVDAAGIAKAVVRFVQARADGRSARLSGASTITQQVMKNFLVGDERSVERKIKEGLLAIRVEQTFTKDQILELYLNEISFGLRSFGIVAAAENYFGKTVEDLRVEEAAYLAALPKGPNNYHPIRNYDAAVTRRNYVLKEMAENGHISFKQARALQKLPLETVVDENRPVMVQRTKQSYFTHEVGRQLRREVGEDMLYHGGLTVRATIDDELQEIAEHALRRGLERFDRRRGTYHGPILNVPGLAEAGPEEWKERLRSQRVPRDIKGWYPAIVLSVGDRTAMIGVEGTDEAAEGRAPGEVRLRLSRESQWLYRTHKKRGRPSNAADIWDVGDVILVKREDNGWSLRQIPEVQGAFMAMDPHSGRVLALQGGYSYESSPFNRATQAQRQPGSSFKPFVFAAALDVGYKPTTLVDGKPIKIGRGPKAWKPRNSSGRFYGPTSLRKGLEQSHNVMTVRIAAAVGMDRVREYAERFGVYENMPEKLSYSLGAGETTLYQVVAAYGMFANGGKRVEPTVIDRIQDRHGKTLFRHDPRYCQGCEVQSFGEERTPILFDARSQIMAPKTAYDLTSMMQGVIKRGTARKTVGGLGFPVAGKTGSTNDNKDAWFVGFTKNLVAGCYIGYDVPRDMGRGSYGGDLCGPVFKEFMRKAHAKHRPGSFSKPGSKRGTVTLKVHALTGERLPNNATGDHVITERYALAPSPELLPDIDPDKIDDVVLQKQAAKTGNVITISQTARAQQVNKGTRQTGSDRKLPKTIKKQSGGKAKRKPSNVGLGTGGLY